MSLRPVAAGLREGPLPREGQRSLPGGEVMVSIEGVTLSQIQITKVLLIHLLDILSSSLVQSTSILCSFFGGNVRFVN